MTDHRTCVIAGCDEPLVRRPGEKLRDFAKRKTCCEDHRRELVAQKNRENSEQIREPEMHPRQARMLLSRLPPRLLPQYEELPLPEQLKVLEGWAP